MTRYCGHVFTEKPLIKELAKGGQSRHREPVTRSTTSRYRRTSYGGAVNVAGESSRMARSETIDALSFEDVLAELSTAFVRTTADQISSEIVRWLQNIGLALEVDRASIGQINPSDGILYATHEWARDGIAPLPHALNANQQVPWLAHKIFAGETVVLGSVEDVPSEAAKDLEYARQMGSKSTVAVPLRIGGAAVGAVVFGSIIRQRTWSPRTLQRQRLIAEVFGNALERERAVAEVSPFARGGASDIASHDDGTVDGFSGTRTEPAARSDLQQCASGAPISGCEKARSR